MDGCEKGLNRMWYRERKSDNKRLEKDKRERDRAQQKNAG